MPFTITGTTTNAFLQIVDMDGGDRGLVFFGTIVNTGANGLTVRITTTDYNGNSDTLTPASIASGGSAKFDTISFSFGPNTRPPFKSIKVDVQAATSNQQTTYIITMTQL